MESFGQIEFYDELFPDIEEDSIKHTIEECIERGLTYCSIYNNRELPLIVGSKFDKSYNPLKVKGYYIIEGVCKSLNSLKIYDKYNYSKNKAYLTDYVFIIENMYTFKNQNNKKIYLPINIKKIVEYSNDPDKLAAHLDIILKLTKKRGVPIKNEIDSIILAYTFDCWLGIREPPTPTWRLLTSPELLRYYIDSNLSIYKAFKSNIWEYKGLKNINTVSEDMKHYNIVSDIESIRRITLPSIRELAPSEKRMVTFYDKHKICPVQTSDGSICGTVNYLVDGAKVYKKLPLNFEDGDDLYLILNNKFVRKIKKPENYEGPLIYFDFTGYGYITESKNILSYSASLIPYIFNNPPVRAMFASKMLKQAIMPDSRNLSNIIQNSKYLKNEVPPLLVAIMPWYGYNVEDAIVISEKASNMYKYTKTKIYRDYNIIVKIYVKTNDYVKKGDLLYKKIDPNEIKKVYLIKADFNGKIGEIVKNNTYLKLVLEYTNVLQVGDKMTSRHGQKGVVSLIIKNPPKLENGEEIDLIINPHAFPSRMTMGQLKEMGNTEKTVYIGENKVNAIVGRCVYYSLIHQVDDKLQIRNSGNFDPITKQPLEGKSKEGGLRFGQMERDILFALNAWNTLTELWSIDRTKILWCKKSGILNPDCCFEYKDINQYFVITLSIIRALDYDILLKDNKYSIIKLDKKRFPKTDSLKFGDTDPSEIRIYNDIVILPICLRSNSLNELYKNIKKNYQKINKETRNLLKGKNGIYHKYIEGHRVDKCIRSVIVPDPTLKIDEVGIPKNANISTNYGILNRQPSLNIDSLKLVKFKYTPNKTISINPLLCASFNADFDGDEMNIYGILNENSINELKEKLIINPIKTQDYIFEEDELKNLTALREGILKMIQKNSKGKMYNYTEIYEKINDIKINNLKYAINGNYNNGLSENDWYLLSIKAREDVASKALNTPISGYLQSNYTLSFT